MKKHAKRLTVPRTLKVPRKKQTFIVRLSPGPHAYGSSVPLLVVVRDMLGLASSSREAKKILRNRKVLVDGRIRKDAKFPVGLADILSLEEMELNFMVMMDTRGRLALKEIGKRRAGRKAYKITNKKLLKGGSLQLNLHDGTNLLVPIKDPSKPKEDVYSTKDTLLVDLKDKKIKSHLEYREGNLAYITGGRNRGKIATIKEIRESSSPMPNTVLLKGRDGQVFETIEDYIFVVGKKKLALPKEVFQ